MSTCNKTLLHASNLQSGKNYNKSQKYQISSTWDFKHARFIGMDMKLIYVDMLDKYADMQVARCY